jgi:putative addiction module CopG family antidote
VDAVNTYSALGRHFEEFVKQLLESGRFNNAGEVVHARLRRLYRARTQTVTSRVLGPPMDQFPVLKLPGLPWSSSCFRVSP